MLKIRTILFHIFDTNLLIIFYNCLNLQFTSYKFLLIFKNMIIYLIDLLDYLLPNEIIIKVHNIYP